MIYQDKKNYVDVIEKKKMAKYRNFEQYEKHPMNRMTKQEMIDNMPENIHPADKKQYLDCVKEFKELVAAGSHHFAHMECILNTAHWITEKYLYNN